MALASASLRAASVWLTRGPRYFTLSRGPKPRCSKFHTKYLDNPDSLSMLQASNHTSKVRNGAISELAGSDACCEVWIRELHAMKRDPWCSFQPKAEYYGIYKHLASTV